MTIGCLFGTFDPPHRSHLAIARYMLDRAGLDQVWWVITPQNPFKQDQHISADHHRVAMARLAVREEHRLRVCEEELKLPRPSYTADALAHFRERWPADTFLLIIGGDNLASFHRWKDPEGILRHHEVLVYPRPGHEQEAQASPFARHPRVRWMNHAPPMDLSSTAVRRALSKGEPVSGRLADAVLDYIRQEGLYAG